MPVHIGKKKKKKNQLQNTTNFKNNIVQTSKSPSGHLFL